MEDPKALGQTEHCGIVLQFESIRTTLTSFSFETDQSTHFTIGQWTHFRLGSSNSWAMPLPQKMFLLSLYKVSQHFSMLVSPKHPFVIAWMQDRIWFSFSTWTLGNLLFLPTHGGVRDLPMWKANFVCIVLASITVIQAQTRLCSSTVLASATVALVLLLIGATIQRGWGREQNLGDENCQIIETIFN